MAEGLTRLFVASVSQSELDHVARAYGKIRLGLFLHDAAGGN